MLNHSTGIDPNELVEVLHDEAKRITYHHLRNEHFPKVSMPQLFDALKASMDIDQAHDRPFCAALVVSRKTILPGSGFFAKAAELGKYDGPPDGEEASQFAKDQMRRVIRLCGGDPRF